MMLSGYRRSDGFVGLRNLLVVASVSDLANDVVLRIAQKVDGAVALLTPTGGLSVGGELQLANRLRLALCANPNVGAVLVVGPTPKDVDDAAASIRENGRSVDTLSLVDAVDSIRAIGAGRRKVERLLEELASQKRHEIGVDTLRVGVRSSSSSAESAETVNPLVGKIVDTIVTGGGTVAFTELADIVAAVEPTLGKAACEKVAHDIRIALGETRRSLPDLLGEMPDPTPTNILGGLTTLEAKGLASLRRLGDSNIESVARFGDPVPNGGLHMIAGPGSAAISLVGFAAAGCNLVLYTVGMFSAIAASPLMPAIKFGPSAFAGSEDVDVCVTGTIDFEDVTAKVFSIAAGSPCAAERSQARQLTLPSSLAPL